MNETTVTIVGNLVDDPRMRTTDSGIEVTSVRIASTSRRFDRDAACWVDAGSVFLGVTCWRSLGVNVVASLGKGDPVLVHGRLFTRQYERDGQVRSAYELDAVAVGPDLARGTAAFQRVTRTAVPATYSPTDEDGVPETSSQSGAEPLPAADAVPLSDDSANPEPYDDQVGEVGEVERLIPAAG
jgi:single-strand DNA-binding protein